MSEELLDISVIIPFKDKSKMTMDCVRSLIKYGPRVKEVLLISNNSSATEVAATRHATSDMTQVKVLEYNHPFNYQKINNWAVQQSKGKYILFLNNDTELTSASIGLLEKMYEKAKLKDVGMVGCLLLYGDSKTVQHAGVFLKPGLQGDHLYVGELYSKAVKNYGTSRFPYDINADKALTAVTGAVQMVQRKKFDAIHGFDERFIICGGDVDLCIRLNKAGYQTWFLGGGYILHKESQSRSHKPIPSSDFYFSYLSYMNGYDLKKGDPFLEKITKVMR